MSRRTVLLLALVIVLCLVVIVLSSYAWDRVAPAFGFLRGREPFGRFGPFGPVPLIHFGPFGRHLIGLRGVVSALASYIFLYLISVMALFVLPRPLRVARDALRRGGGEILRLFGIGVLGGLAALALIALGALTFVAFPLSLVLSAALFLAAAAGMVAVALALGRGVNRWAGLPEPSPLFDLALGALIVFALARIPVAGWAIVALFGALGLGVVIATRFGAGSPWSLADFQPAEEVSHEPA